MSSPLHTTGSVRFDRVFSSPDVIQEIRWLVAESKCLIIRRACEISISDLCHYMPTLDTLNQGVGVTESSCIRCSDGTVWPGYYLNRHNILNLFRILDASDQECHEADTLMGDEFTICTDCTLCAIVHKSPKKLLLSVLDQINEIESEGLWPYDPVVIREISY